MESPIFLANFFISVIPAAFVANWIYYRCKRSIAAAVLTHSMLNAAAVLIDAGQVAKCIATVLYAIIAALIVAFDGLFRQGPATFVDPQMQGTRSARARIGFPRFTSVSRDRSGDRACDCMRCACPVHAGLARFRSCGGHSLLAMPASSPGTKDAYDLLLEAIDQGEFRPGDRLVESELAERFGVSRTPIREALQRLETQCVVARDGRSLVVSSLDHDQLGELYVVRAELEGLAARLAAQHAAPEEIAVLWEMVASDRALVAEPDRLARANRRFHRQIHLASHNRYLIQQLEMVHRSMALRRHHLARRRGPRRPGDGRARGDRPRHRGARRRRRRGRDPRATSATPSRPA